jgi:erythronate-4-phosphate dehydrogenase
VGSRVVKRALALGMRVLENDPPLARETGDARYRPIEELLGCDVLTFHVPLMKEGPDATHHLADADFLARLRPDCLIFNASRGPVVANEPLKAALRDGKLAGAVLDVWEGEPSADPELADMVYLATPHIAGHSFDGKVNGTNLVYRQVCEWLGREPEWTPEAQMPETNVPLLELDATGRADEDVLREACFAVYPIQQDVETFRANLSNPDPDARAASFSSQRSNYPCRREFALTTVRLTDASEALKAKFAGLTFRV